MISYQKYKFTIDFEKKIYFDIFPGFIFRSVLGMELRKISCIFKGKKCQECDLKYQCVYSNIFETPIDKNNQILPGRNKAPHSFILSTEDLYRKTTSKIEMELTLLGQNTKYFPYIYYALKQAGENGILRHRVKYKITEITVDNNSILNEHNNLKIIENKIWKKTEDTKIQHKKIKIELKTPLRIKKEGKYLDKITYSDIISATQRRMKTLLELYGEEEDLSQIDFLEKVETAKTYWLELERYSSRQRTKMKLGGVVGTIIVEGEFSKQEQSLIEFASLFNLGKNTGFGLGNINLKKI